MYESAQQHYNKLKKQMLNTLINNTTIENLTEEQMADLVLQTENQYNTGNLSSETNRLLEKFEKVLLDNRDDYSSYLQEIDQAIQRGEKKAIIAAKEGLKQALKENQRFILQEALKTSTIARISANDYATVFSQMRSILVYSLMSNKNIQMYRQSAIRIGGFVKEVGELKALRKRFSSSQFQSKAIQTFLVGDFKSTTTKKDTPLDLIITTLSDVEIAFNQAERITENIEQYINGQASYENINVFGEQSKSWNLTSRTRFYEIGFRKNLLDSYKSIHSKDYKDVENAINYLAQVQNTLQVFGPLNVLFSTGNQRWWMDDFIKEISQRGLQVIFKSSENKYYEPSSEIGITDVYRMYKTQKVGMRRAYSR